MPGDTAFQPDNVKVHILRDLEAVSNAAAVMFVNFSGQYIAVNGRFVVAVSGGYTPERLYALLSSDRYRNGIDWRSVHFFWVDERFVPHDHKDSNYRLLKENLLDRVPVPSGNIHPVDTHGYSPSVSAKKYEEEMKIFFRLPQGDLPDFDLVLLGIGEDGHTASVFPGSTILKDEEHLVTAAESKNHMHPRITLTLPVINNSKNIIFLASGKNKSAIIKRVLGGRYPSLPASMVRPYRGSLFYLIDRDAGMYLPHEGGNESAGFITRQ